MAVETSGPAGSGQQDLRRQELLAKAAARTEAIPSVGDQLRYLEAYYHHVDPGELLVAGPERTGAAAAAHALLAARRPQGRAAVEVRPGGAEALLPGHDVIDVVTDDMPFLIDTITMTLAGQDIAAEIVVHPQLLIRRDIAGTLREVLGSVRGALPIGQQLLGESADGRGGLAPDELAESWSHIEVAELTAAKREAVATALESGLADLRMAVEDYPKMRARAVQLAEALAKSESGAPSPLPSATGTADSVTEIEMLLRWLVDAHFTFLGYREYDLLTDGDKLALRGVPGTGLGILRHDKPSLASVEPLPPEVAAGAKDVAHRLILTKANSRATVHRPSYLDYIGVKRLSETGEVTGEYRFLGLYTHDAISESITRVPVLRRKLTEVLALIGVPGDSHDGRDIAEFVEDYPREELFQTPVEALAEVAIAVLRLRERLRTRLFLRKDPYGRYVSCLVYLSRDRYNTKVRLGVQDVLRRELNASQVDYRAVVDEGAIARLHIVLRAERGQSLADPNVAALEREIAAVVRSWDDDLAQEAARQLGDGTARELLALVGDSISETYKTDVPATTAVGDLARAARMLASGADIEFEMWESAGYVGGVPIDDDREAIAGPDGERRRVWRLTIFRTGAPITLTDVLPRLQNMGMEVVDEHPYEFPALQPFWIYDFGLRRQPAVLTGSAGPAAPAEIELSSVAGQLEGALTALWRGEIENDGFNTLVLEAGLRWRQVIVLRAYAKYLRQAGTMFSQDYIARVLRSNPVIARRLIQLFESRFDPGHPSGEAERDAALNEEIQGELDAVASLDEDRILRAYLGLILATQRTNYFQVGADGEHAPYLVFKLDAAEVPDLPAPRPKFELFVYSPRFEGVHLRFASVARGGLRWSDRREDFRTEILGLAKAQEVKNSVIVPSGAKGGFVCKELPDPADRDAYQAEVLACYRMFISAMLDVTDNLIAGKLVPPERVVRHDGDDPYLVVAADKGTATFSDTANEIALSRGFWLGDAFASGGSAGYDHKKIGITARGAWESVRFHFAGLGIDVDADQFTVVGVGDMSGDVFGNGMLLSRKIRLLAAFDHRHIFIDPDPDPEASYLERRRLFDLPRSSWADYDPAVISAGGGVWPRSAKSVPLSEHARTALGLDPSVLALAPDQVISAILAAPVDLLWNGGIGTYVKASFQPHSDAGDRTNDAVRVDASALRAKVVGEGGNLGLTQEARIEYALAGGLVNTDFIDNSAGVDTSDHEGNIKILLYQVVRDGELTTAERDVLLQQMTDEVAGLVLAHNYHQNRALAAARAQASQMLHVHARYIRKLEREGRIRRRLDVLPADKDIAERRSASTGLTLPEFSVLLAHTKIAAGQDVLGSSLPDDPFLEQVLASYFPEAVRERYGSRLARHRLHREIATTVLINDMVDRAGITFAFRLNEETGASVPDITAAWLIARQAFDMAGFWQRLKELDGQVDSSSQTLAILEGRKLTERVARWLLHYRRPPFGIQALVDYFSGGVRVIEENLPGLLTGLDLAGFGERRDLFLGRDFPRDLAERIAAMVPAYSAFDIVEIATAAGRNLPETAAVYFDLADRLQIARLRDRITALPRDDRWSTMARAALRDDLYAAHAALARDVLTAAETGTTEERLAAWTARNESAVARAAQTLIEIWESNSFTVSTLSVAVRAIRTLVSSSSLPF